MVRLVVREQPKVLVSDFCFSAIHKRFLTDSSLESSFLNVSLHFSFAPLLWICKHGPLDLPFLQDALYSYGVADIFDKRNGLLWCDPIEKVFVQALSCWPSFMKSMFELVDLFCHLENRIRSRSFMFYTQCCCNRGKCLIISM